jgi:hypothetical protein
MLTDMTRPRLWHVLLAFATLSHFSTYAAAQATDAPRVPAISLIYAGLLENHCARMMKVPVDTEAVREARARAKEFDQLWQREAPRLLEEVVRQTGHGFSFREAVAALHVCPGLPSGTSMPLTINMIRFLDATTMGKPEPLERFAPVLLHETLHRYIVATMQKVTGREEPFTGTTPLLQKYGAENYTVRAHLHLMAIEEAVYSALEKHQALADIRARDQEFPSYKRARAIVLEEGAAKLLAEIRGK